VDLYDLLMKRRSVRSFEDRPVPEELLDELLDAAVNAPSGGNIQPLSIIVVEDPAARAELAEMVGGQPWVANAPTSLVFCIDFHRVKRWASTFDVEFRGEESLLSFLIAFADIMCAAQSVVVLAEARGLGSVYVGTILSSIDYAREYFAMPEHVLPVMVLSLGFPKSVPRNIPKLDRHAAVHSEKYAARSDDDVADDFERKYGSIDDDVDRYLERAYVEAVERDKQAPRDDGSWVGDVKRRMQKLEVKSNAEFLFRVRYPQDLMVRFNRDLVRALEKAGFRYPLAKDE